MYKPVKFYPVIFIIIYWLFIYFILHKMLTKGYARRILCRRLYLGPVEDMYWRFERLFILLHYMHDVFALFNGLFPLYIFFLKVREKRLV